MALDSRSKTWFGKKTAFSLCKEALVTEIQPLLPK
jgi:hypothetical protein